MDADETNHVEGAVGKTGRSMEALAMAARKLPNACGGQSIRSGAFDIIDKCHRIAAVEFVKALIRHPISAHGVAN